MQDIGPLPEDPQALKAMVLSLQAEREQLRQQLQGEKQRFELQTQHLQQELLRLKKMVYGPRADRLSTAADVAQLLLEFAATLEQRPIDAGDLPAGSESAGELRRVQRRRGRRHLASFEHLPLTRRVYDLSAQERACPGCGSERRRIGEESSWQIEYIPARFERIEHVRVKYGCRHCEGAAENPRIETAAKATAAIDKGMAGPGLLAFIVTSKFNDYLPLYRLEDIFERHGFEISRATQSVWCGDVADLLLPLYQCMVERVRQSQVIATDDTPMPMLHPGQVKRARMWVYVGDAQHPYNVFDFTESRGRDGPQQFLQDYRNTLLADAYGGYDGVVVGNQMRRAGCWAHARRKFVDAEASAPEIATEAVACVRALYQLEEQAKNFDAVARLALRQAQSLPLLTHLRDRLLLWKQQLLPKHPMTEAVNYALHQWPELSVFCSDGAVPLDNNVSEREMKRIVLNRKNSLFVGNARGGRTAAILSSFTSTCRRHAIDPQLYLTQLLVNLPDVGISDLPAWLPDQWKLRQAAMLP